MAQFCIAAKLSSSWHHILTSLSKEGKGVNNKLTDLLTNWLNN